MSIARVTKALDLLESIGKVTATHSTVDAMVKAVVELREAKAELQALAQNLERDCCNSSCHLADTLDKLKG